MASHTHPGLFKYTVMPFSLINVPTTFQVLIQDTLHNLLNISCVIYLDDILVFSHPEQDHEALVIQAFEQL